MVNVDRAPILVGIDGSPEATRAAVWGAREAVVRHRPLALVHTYEWAHEVGPGPGALRVADVRYRDVFVRYAEVRIKAATAEVLNAVPGVELTSELVAGRPVQLLSARSADAALVVVGSRGHGGVSGLLLGSVAVGLVSHAKCPVVIVRGEDRPPEYDELNTDVSSAVVVGLDGSPMSEAALGYAYDWASAHGAPLVAVHAWGVVAEDSRLLEHVDLEAVQQDEERLLAEQLAGWGEKYPDVSVRRVVVKDRPARALLEAAAFAGLLVVGARGRGGMAGLLLGSTSQALIHRSACPVVVVRPGEAHG